MSARTARCPACRLPVPRAIGVRYHPTCGPDVEALLAADRAGAAHTSTAAGLEAVRGHRERRREERRAGR